jgi:hypothetical protein
MHGPFAIIKSGGNIALSNAQYILLKHFLRNCSQYTHDDIKRTCKSARFF